MGLKSKKHVRLFSAKILYETGELTKETAQTLLEDSDSHIRKIGFNWMLNSGHIFSLVEVSKLFPKSKTTRGLLDLNTDVTEDEIIPIVLAQKEFDELVSLIDFYSLDGQRVYNILSSKYSHLMYDRFRRDLNDNFQVTKKDSEEKMFEQYGTKSNELIKSYKSDVIKYMTNTFIASALRGILNDNQASDITYARKYISTLEFGENLMSAVEVIGKYGDESDEKSLFEASKHIFSDKDKEKIVGMILSLSNSKKDLLTKLAKDEDAKIAEASLSSINILTRPQKLILLKELLLSKHDNVRKLSATLLTTLMGKIQLDEYLDEYINLGHYFYDVVTIFDNYLYTTELLTKPRS